MSRTQTTVSTIESVMLLVHENGGLVSFSPDAIRLGLLPDAALSGRTLNDLPKPLAETLAEALKSDRKGGKWEVAWSRPTGGVTLRVEILPRPPDASCPIGVAVSWLAEPSAPSPAPFPAPAPTAAESSDPALFAGMAHDIKNSLVGVKTLVELSLERDPNMEMAKIVKNDLDRISFLVSQMLRSAGPAPSDFHWIRVHPILEMSLQLIQSKIGGREIRLVKDLQAGHDEIWGDPYQMEQVFLNLLINGIEAIPEAGELKVRSWVRRDPRGGDSPGAKSESGQLVVSVTDNGSGISSDHLGRLFDDFFTTKAEGTGLGLPITRRIVLSHRGEISVKSELSKGTTFELVFPLRAREAPIPA